MPYSLLPLFCLWLACSHAKADWPELNTGVTLYQRMTAFEHEDSTQTAFTMDGGYKPRPWLGLNFGDEYFGNSRWGYTLGVSYYIDHSNQQHIERNDDERSTRLGTRSRTEVYALKPALFYRFDLTPKHAVKAGLGITLGYSRVRGSAYKTEYKADADCYAAAGRYIDIPTKANKHSIRRQCQRIHYSSNSATRGALIFFEFEQQYWRWELAVAIYDQTHSYDNYHFSATEFSIGVARRWSL